MIFEVYEFIGNEIVGISEFEKPGDAIRHMEEWNNSTIKDIYACWRFNPNKHKPFETVYSRKEN